MPNEYTILLTPRQRDSLLDERLQRWLVEGEKGGHPYWVYTVAQIVEQIMGQNNKEQINEYKGEEFKFNEDTKAHDTCQAGHPLQGDKENGDHVNS